MPRARLSAAPAIGTYLLDGGGGGRLRVTEEDGHRMAMVDVEVPCFGHLFFTQIPVSANGHVAMAREVMGKRSLFSTRIEGAFAPAKRVQLTLRAKGGGCDARAVAYEGHRP